MIEHLKKHWSDRQAEDETPEEQSAVSTRGRVLSELLSTVTNELAIGKDIKSGKLRKRMVEPPMQVPGCFTMTSVDMPDFTMKLLESKENPNTDKVILQLHGGGYMGAVRNAYYVFAGLYNEVSHGMAVLTPDYRGRRSCDGARDVLKRPQYAAALRHRRDVPVDGRHGERRILHDELRKRPAVRQHKGEPDLLKRLRRRPRPHGPVHFPEIR
jgi:hypothetical protein